MSSYSFASFACFLVETKYSRIADPFPHCSPVLISRPLIGYGSPPFERYNIAVRHGRHKLVLHQNADQSPTPEPYDLTSDPLETRNPYDIFEGDSDPAIQAASDGIRSAVGSINGDFDDDLLVGISELLIFGQACRAREGDPNWNPVVDMDSDGVVDATDYLLFMMRYGRAPGPSGLF